MVNNLYNKILIIDDDEDLSFIISDMLEGYGYQVTWAEDSEKAFDLLERNTYHLILLDINLPDADGFEICQELRRTSTTPVVFASARTSETDRITGYDIGGDDYLPKPFKTAELLARVRAMLRRKDNYTPDLLTVGNLILNRSTYEIIFGNSRRTLSGKEFQVLEMLMEKPNMIVTIEEIMTHIWGWDAEVDTSVIWVHISNIRKKLEAVSSPFTVRFVRNGGYLLEEKK